MPTPNSLPPITLVSPAFAPDLGGVETHVHQLGERLALAGHDVHVLTQASQQVITDHGQVAHATSGLTVHRFPRPRLAGELLSTALLRRVRTHGAAGHVIHAHNYHALPFLAAALTATPGRLVLTTHYHGVGRTPLRTAAHRTYRLAGARALRRASSVIAVSTAERDLLLRDFGSEMSAKTRVIPNGVSPRGGAARHLAAPTVFTWGRLAPYKNVDVLITAVARIPDAHLVVAGDGPARPELESLVDRLGVRDRVTLLGRVSEADLSNWLASPVVTATLSSIEAYGLTLAESLAARRHVVASDLPAHRSVAATAHPGALVSPVTFVPLTGTSPRVGQVTDALRDALARAATPGPEAALPTWADVTEQIQQLYADLPGLAEPGTHCSPTAPRAAARRVA